MHFKPEKRELLTARLVLIFLCHGYTQCYIKFSVTCSSSVTNTRLSLDLLTCHLFDPSHTFKLFIHDCRPTHSLSSIVLTCYLFDPSHTTFKLFSHDQQTTHLSPLWPTIHLWIVVICAGGNEYVPFFFLEHYSHGYHCPRYVLKCKKDARRSLPLLSEAMTTHSQLVVSTIFSRRATMPKLPNVSVPVL